MGPDQTVDIGTLVQDEGLGGFFAGVGYYLIYFGNTGGGRVGLRGDTEPG